MPAIAYIDESGNLAEANEPIALGGIVFRTPPRNHLLRARLESACPGVPWPLHAAQQRYSAYLALAAARGETGPYPPSREAERAAARLDAAGQLAALPKRAIWRTRIPDLQNLDLWLGQNHPGLYWRLQGQLRASGSRVDQLLDSLATEAFAFAVWSPPGRLRGTPAYRDLARALGRRAEAVWGSNRATLAAQYNDLTVPTLSQDLGGLAVPLDYDSSAPAGLVLADLLINRLRRLLSRTTRTWADLTTAWPRKLPLVVVPPGGTSEAPLLGVAGRLRADVDDVARQLSEGLLPPEQVPEALAGLRPPWAGEQAAMWFATHSHLDPAPNATGRTGGWA